MAPGWRRKNAGARCPACRGSGLRWGWWTLIVTLPVQVVTDILTALLPWVVLGILVIVGVSLFSASFWLFYAALCAIAAVLLIHYAVKLIAPSCRVCGGRGLASMT